MAILIERNNPDVLPVSHAQFLTLYSYVLAVMESSKTADNSLFQRRKG